MTRWTPGATAAVVLTACLGVGWAGAVIAVAAEGPMTRDGLLYVAGIGQTLAGALAALVGIAVGHGNRIGGKHRDHGGGGEGMAPPGGG